MMMAGSTETGKTHLAVKTIENGLWGSNLTSVYWFSPNELAEEDMHQKCSGISRNIAIGFVAIGSVKALERAISDLRVDIKKIRGTNSISKLPYIFTGFVRLSAPARNNIFAALNKQ